jgi:hypothetical protein
MNKMGKIQGFYAEYEFLLPEYAAQETKVFCDGKLFNSALHAYYVLQCKFKLKDLE